MELTSIKNKIFEIRDCKDLLDFDLAELYQVETRTLKQSVKRNLDRFPDDFMFQLTKSEWTEVITNCDNLPENVKFSPVTPFAFTEQGVAMLSSVLKSKTALNANIAIMRAFVFMRKFALTHKDLKEKLMELESKYDKQFAEVYEAHNYLVGEKQKQVDFESRKRIGYKNHD
jgi:hypothetical protein